MSKIEKTEHEINEILDFIFSCYELEQNSGKITKEIAEDEEADGCLNDLIDYEVSIETDGDHKNDGQLVDYSFTFTSPTGDITTINTEMCLMVGFNYHKSVIIN